MLDSMICRIAVMALLVSGLFAADDPWDKVVALKSGSELKIYKKGVAEPVSASFDEANGERILIVDRKGQSSIAKDDIDRIDSRPAAPKNAKRMKTETTVKTTEPDYTPHPPGGVPVPGTSSSSGVSFSSTKESFATVYRRPPAEPRK